MYGDAIVTGYKVYVNGVVEALLGADQFTYSFTHGKWCREYVFQVQVSCSCVSAIFLSGRTLFFVYIATSKACGMKFTCLELIPLFTK